MPGLKPNRQVAFCIAFRTIVQFAYCSSLSVEDMGHKKDKAGEFFHLILNGGKEAGLFDLVYFYNWKGGLMLTRVDLLPANWHVLFLPLTPNKLQVLMPEKDGCLFQFDLYDPFTAEVL